MATSKQPHRRDSVNTAGWQQPQELPAADTRSSTPDPRVKPPGPHGYDTLDDRSRQIRLCRISYATDSPVLALDRETLYLRDVRGRFIAISYNWAGVELQEEIRVNGLSVKITCNLYTQLCRLRSLGCKAPLWIDHLSIHQFDKVEKSAQVAMMSEIYLGTQTVYVALDDCTKGMHNDKADHALIAGAIEELAGGKHFRDLGWFSDQSQPDPVDSAVEKLLYRVLNTGWWKRVWVVQEVVLAPACDILLASGFISWSSFAAAVERLNTCRKADCCSTFLRRRDPGLEESIHAVCKHGACRSQRYTQANDAGHFDVDIQPYCKSPAHPGGLSARATHLASYAMLPAS
jgi:hypothetical protein